MNEVPCPVCGKGIDGKARKCRFCGNWVCCPNCQERRPNKNRFCSNCGREIPGIPREEPTPAEIPQHEYGSGFIDSVSASDSAKPRVKGGWFWMVVPVAGIIGLFILISSTSNREISTAPPQPRQSAPSPSPANPTGVVRPEIAEAPAPKGSGVRPAFARQAPEVYQAWPFGEAEAKRRQRETAVQLGLPVEQSVDLGGGVTLDLALIPAGKFVMGSTMEGYRYGKETRHEVTITKPFYMAKCHTTVAQFRRFVAATNYQTLVEKEGWGVAWGERDDHKFGGDEQVKGASWKRPGFEQGEDHPVVELTWDDAQAFAIWLSQQSGRPVRLPMEAEWEYACRAGTMTEFQWGDNPNDGSGWLNARDLTFKKRLPYCADFWLNWEDGYTFTSPVGTYLCNAWGLYDMHGNSWQWCEDCLEDPFAKGSHNPYRVQRGGAWDDPWWPCRSAYRRPVEQGDRKLLWPLYVSGFRVVVEIPASVQ